MAIRILCIETALSQSSVALFEDDVCLHYCESIAIGHTAELVNTQIAEIMDKTGSDSSSWDAIAVSGGPGSYTGLRIGVSTAKGICFARDLPLIHIDTTEIMVIAAKESVENASFYLASIDARRNDIFYALYDRNIQSVMPISFTTIDEELFANINIPSTIVIGSGASKVLMVYKNMQKSDSLVAAKNMGIVAKNKFLQGDYEDIAYYEPRYHKAFYTTYKPKS